MTKLYAHAKLWKLSEEYLTLAPAFSWVNAIADSVSLPLYNDLVDDWQACGDSSKGVGYFDDMGVWLGFIALMIAEDEYTPAGQLIEV